MRIFSGRSDRKGVAIHLILSLLICFTVLTLAWVYGSARSAAKPSFMLKLKADYQMESAILLNFHRIRTIEANFSQNTEPWNPRQEIAPGIVLKSGCRKMEGGAYRIVTSVEGPSYSRLLAARAFKEEVPRATHASGTSSETASDTLNDGPASAPEAIVSPSWRWRLEFFPNQGEKL